MPASQSYLDATRNATFDTPTEWDTIATAWENDVTYDEVATQSWVDVGVESPTVATLVSARGLVPDDVAMIRAFFDPDNLPALEDAIAAIAIVKGIKASGGNFSQAALTAIFSTFFSELASGNVSLTLDPLP